MRTVGRLSIIALTVIIAAAALAAGERASAARSPRAASRCAAPRETSVTRPPLRYSPRGRIPTSLRPSRARLERQKMFAWLLLLLKDHRAAR